MINIKYDKNQNNSLFICHILLFYKKFRKIKQSSINKKLKIYIISLLAFKEELKRGIHRKKLK